jgi:hypothetical protein
VPQLSPKGNDWGRTNGIKSREAACFSREVGDEMKERPGYGDAEAKRIIDRAAEIDVEHGRRLDAPALREIAVQAGISPLAVDQALQEHETSAAASAVNRVPWSKRNRARLAVVALVSGLLLLFFSMRMEWRSSPAPAPAPAPPVGVPPVSPAPPMSPAP